MSVRSDSRPVSDKVRGGGLPLQLPPPSSPELLLLRSGNQTMRAIDRLLKVAGTDRKIYREVDIKGEDFSFWMKPLTIAEQQSAQRSAKSDDANDFAIQLLIKKAQDENGAQMFQADAAPMLRNAVEKAEVEKLLLALIREDEEEAPDLDMKSPKKAVKD